MAGAGALWNSGRPNESNPVHVPRDVCVLVGKCQDGFPLPKE